ncbi:hypothetical protein LUZ61_009572 [Rhynchospora tenuis]|uniref:BED-type domain-containing protein n=1 Tax=Rhynchospora tenuis TaxID=198213 RepID=A0AAD6EYF8_9POAL|nr:hypothetical protein LUZ61_009572 [Rhynchospora tenuis]
MGLHPDLTADHIRAIEDDANAKAQDPEGAPQAQGENAAEGDVPITKKRKSKGKRTAEAWKHFTKGEDQDDGSYDATCKYCGEVYLMGNQRGTGSLNHHIKKGCEKIPTRFKRTKLQQMLQVQSGLVEGNNKVAVWKFDQAICRKNLAIMVIVHEYPFNCVTHHYFRVFLKSLQPEFKLVSRNTLRSFSLVLDNASSNDACIRELLSGPLKESLPADGSVFHKRCGCHILNLIVQDGLSVLSAEITKVRETMKYIRDSQARMEKFKLAATQARATNRRPAWDVPTRWNSTYLMLELACELRPAIDRFASMDNNYKLKLKIKDVEWVAVHALMDCLKVFYNATLKFSATKYPSLNFFFAEMCEEYSDAYSTYLESQSGSSSRPHSKSKQASSSGSANVSDVRAGLREFMRGKRTSEPVKSELDQYLCEPLDETGVDDEFDILTWWKLKVPKYPVLSRLTRDILAVPASTVASESTFSTSGRTLSTVRNCLNDESMEALICAQDWLRARIAENGVQVGDTLWASDNAVSDDTICGNT